MTKMSWNQAICELCWIIQKGVWEEDETGEEILTGVQVPTRAVIDEVEQCSYCGGPTIVGIFVRDDPKKVPYPREENDDADLDGSDGDDQNDRLAGDDAGGGEGEG